MSTGAVLFCGKAYICAMFSHLITNRFLARFCATAKVSMTKAQGDNCRLISAVCDVEGITDPRQVAYVLGTVHHECRFKSIQEMRAKKGTPVWRMQEKYWHTGYYGRGFCQLTWDYNYKKFSPIVGLDLLAHPDEVLKPDVGAVILVVGMRDGLFSGKSLSRYFSHPPLKSDWEGARKIVNGTFQAEKVAWVAKVFLDCIHKERADQESPIA